MVEVSDAGELAGTRKEGDEETRVSFGREGGRRSGWEGGRRERDERDDALYLGLLKAVKTKRNEK